jgi:hypothetical protein
MFNGDLKKKALDRLKNTNESYQKKANEVTNSATKLHNLRLSTSRDIIYTAEKYINTLANSPKEFQKSVSELKISFSRFEEILEEVQRSDNVAKVGGSTVGAGVAAGVGVAAFGPTAAMAVATTFGTASTGTAISALSGAAATNAALAWLGGGALAAGGGGMAAGNALLALAGPIGWGIGLTALAGAGYWARCKNQKIAEEANKETNRILTETSKLKSALFSIGAIHTETMQHSDGAKNQLRHLTETAPKDYKSFNDDQKYEIGALVNNINSLSVLLNKTIN